MASLIEFFEVVIAEWRGRGVPLRPGAARAEVERLFADLRCPLSADVLDLYTAVDGFADDGRGGPWRLWPLAEIRRRYDHHRRSFVPFADWSCGSHVYALRFEGPEVASVHLALGDRRPRYEPLAPSLADFLVRLLCDPRSVGAEDFDT